MFIDDLNITIWILFENINVVLENLKTPYFIIKKCLFLSLKTGIFSTRVFIYFSSHSIYFMIKILEGYDFLKNTLKKFLMYFLPQLFISLSPHYKCHGILLYGKKSTSPYLYLLSLYKQMIKNWYQKGTRGYLYSFPLNKFTSRKFIQISTSPYLYLSPHIYCVIRKGNTRVFNVQKQ